MIAELMQRIADLELRVGRIVRFGEVATIGTEITVRYPDGTTSEPMPYGGSSAAFDVDPTVGDQAVVLCEGGDPEMAVALVGLSSVDAAQGNKTGVARADLVEAEILKIRQAIILSAVGVAGDSGAGYKANMANYLGTSPNDPGEVDASKARVD